MRVKALNEEFGLNLPEEKFSIIPARLEKRALSLVIDFIILEVLMFSIIAEPMKKFFSGNLSDMIQSFNNINPGLILIFISGASLISILYFSLFDYYLNGTPGKTLLGIRVKSDNLQSAVIRNISTIMIFPFNWLFIIDLYFLITKKYRYLEKLSNSYSYEIIKINS